MDLAEYGSDSIDDVSELDPVLDKAVDQATQSNSVLPLLKVEINAEIKLRRPGLTATNEAKKPTEMNKTDLMRREMVKARNILHARESRIRRKRKKGDLEKAVAQYEAENARLESDVQQARRQVQILRAVLQSHHCCHVHGKPAEI